MKDLITGIQQVGIGVSNCDEAKYFYKDIFGMNVLIFDDISSAHLMTKYTGNKLHERRAILTMNLSGGGGFELWQFLSRTPCACQAQFGDIGIFAVKLKCRNINDARDNFKKCKLSFTSDLLQSPEGKTHFWVKDKYNNFFNVAEANSWFKKDASSNGGVYGAIIGVSDMETSLNFYKNVLGIDEVIYDSTSTFPDVPHHSDETFRRVVIRKKKSTTGAFTNLLGDVEIELIQTISARANKIFANRYWGDCGFIHLCFDVTDMNELKKLSQNHGYNFTVDSNKSYAMEKSAGRFCYVEDPDGTLIELVETHKVPVFKKLGLYINLKNRKNNKPLPRWMINFLRVNKVK